MEQVATANIDGAAAVRLAGTDSGWATTTVLKNGDTVTVLTYPAADDGDGCIAAPPSIDARADEARLKATSPGWHRIRTQAAPGGGILVTATYEGARLRPPAAVPGETNTWRFWLDPENEPETTVAARDLSRYFILGWTKEGTLARELEERRGTDDPYPELSRAALDKEELLVKLADRPEELSEEEWDAIHEVGEQAIRTLRTDAETS